MKLLISVLIRLHNKEKRDFALLERLFSKKGHEAVRNYLVETSDVLIQNRRDAVLLYLANTKIDLIENEIKIQKLIQR